MARAIFARTDNSRLSRWWWTVDRWILFALCVLMGTGILLSFAGTPLIAKKLGLSSFHMAEKQLILFIPSFFIMIAVSTLSIRSVRKLSFLVFIVSVIMLAMTPFFGSDIKGARRWMSLMGFSIQSSEFVKPAFVIVSAWFMSLNPYDQSARFLPPAIRQFPKIFSFVLYLLVVLFLLMEPDLGMTLVVTSVWGVQLFLAGLPLIWVLLAGGFGFIGLLGAYFFFPHVSSRIDRFLDPEAGDRYQINRSLEAFASGGVFGQGPGEGIIKKHLPDAHSDFIFAVAGEEFGLFFCLFVVGLYAFIVYRSFSTASKDPNLFVLLSVGGISLQFALQAMINMASSLHMIPTKGMTLPFLSYGGSSLIALAFGMGILLCLTRKRLGIGT